MCRQLAWQNVIRWLHSELPTGSSAVLALQPGVAICQQHSVETKVDDCRQQPAEDPTPNVQPVYGDPEHGSDPGASQPRSAVCDFRGTWPG